MKRLLPPIVSTLLFSSSANAQSALAEARNTPRLHTEWTAVYEHGLTGHDRCSALARDDAGNLYAAGASLGYNGTYTYEILTLAYAPDGTQLWEARYDSAGSGFDDGAVDVEVAADGSVDVLGQGPGSSGDQDIVLLKYDGLGVLQWVERFDHYWSDGAEALALAPDGSVYVTGSTYTVGSVTDVLLLKHSASGALLWSRFYHGGQGTDWPIGVEVDANGDVVVVGNGIGPPGGVNFDWLVLKYDPDGNLLWDAWESGPALLPDDCYAFHVDASGRSSSTATSRNRAARSRPRPCVSTRPETGCGRGARRRPPASTARSRPTRRATSTSRAARASCPTIRAASSAGRGASGRRARSGRARRASRSTATAGSS